MDIVVCCHLDATGVSALELEAAGMLLAVLGLCKDMVPSVLMQNCTLFGEELDARPWMQFISTLLCASVFRGRGTSSMVGN